MATIKVIDFDLPLPVNTICRDFVRFSGATGPSFSQKHYCGSTIPTISLVDKDIFVQFNASHINAGDYRGFQINYAPCK